MPIDWAQFVKDIEEESRKGVRGIDWDYVLSEPDPVPIPTKQDEGFQLPSMQDISTGLSKATAATTAGIAGIDDKLSNTRFFKWLQSRSPEKPPAPGEPGYEEYMKNWSEEQANKPIRTGFTDALSLGITPKINKNLYGEDIDPFTQAQEQAPKRYAAGKIAGEALKSAAMYNVANPLAKQIPGINKIKNPFLRTQATMLGADTLVNIPSTMVEGAVEGKSKEEMLKDFAVREATDTAVNLVVGGVGELIKHLKKGKLAKVDPVKDVVEELPTKPVEGYQISRDAPKVSKASVPNKQLAAVQQEWNEAVDKFTEFRKWLNNGAFGQPATPEEFELFKESTGIDIEDIIRRMKAAEKLQPSNIVRKMADRRRLGVVAGVYDPIKINKPLIPEKFAETKNIAREAVPDTSGFLETKPNIPQEAKFLPQKDIKPVNKNFKDFYRNMKDVYGENYDIVNDGIIKPFNEAKKSNVIMQKKWTDKTYDYIVKELGIKKGSKMSALVQKYGEGNITEDQLRKMLKPKDVDKIIKADEFFRNSYNELLETINNARIVAYPNDPDMLIKPRKDYYRHFQDTSGSYAEKIKKVLNLGDDTPKMSSRQRRPKTSYFSIGKERKGGKYTEDAVGGFLDYIKAASYATNIDPQIPKIRELANNIHKVAPGKYQNFVNYLHEFADDLAGRQNPLDKSIQNIIGRRAFTVLDKLNKRTKANAVMGNVSSSLSQIANVPQGIATIKDPIALTKGAGDTLAGVIGQGKVNQLHEASGFLSERYVTDLYSRFDSKLIDQPKKFATWMLSALDEIGTKFIWNSAFRKGVKDGVADPIQFADDLTRNMVAGRGIGELPLIQKSKVFQMLAPFQVEVANLWHVQKDMISEKDFAGIIILYLANNVLNKGLESIRGSGATFDPIDAINDAINEDDPTIGKIVGRLSGEVLSNIPLGQSAAALVPEKYRQQLFGKQDPTRFGTGLPLAQAASRPLNVLLPWGGGQVSKTMKGLTAAGKIPELNPLKENFGEVIDQPGVYSFSGGEKKLRYPIEDTPKARLQAVLFGPGATDQARQYYEEDMKMLTPKQTKQVEHGVDYNTIQNIRKLESLRRQIDEVAQDPSLTNEKKEEKINKLVDKIEKLVSELGG